MGAALWAVIAMMLWFGILRLDWQFPLNGVTQSTWHAHEMIYGFSVAVVAGFLLTAVPNWTESKPVSGIPLVLVFFSWLVARISSLVGSDYLLPITTGLDLLFILGLLLCIALPVVRQGQWKQVGILVKVIFLGLANGAYYLGVSGHLENGIAIGLYSGFYLIIALILTLGRRVIPLFIERRLRLSQPLVNYKWVDISVLALFLVFFGLQLSFLYTQWIQIVALLLFILHAFRLSLWHRSGIWGEPLLWVLFIGYGLIVFSFALIAAPLFGARISPFQSLHLFSVGGIGLITCGMMARISLGHTGRDIRKPPRVIPIAFVCIVLAAIFRVFLPMHYTERYFLWITISQWLWILGFVIFIVNYAVILLTARADGKHG